MNDPCTQAEMLAGAIALGEAAAAEREAYRRHIAGCARCLETLGGERRIEGVMASIGAAREAETWDPVPVNFRRRARSRAWMTGAFAVLGAIALAFGLQTAIATAVHADRNVHAVAMPSATFFHVALETRPRPAAPKRVTAPVRPAIHRPAPVQIAAQPQQQRRLVVVHNVITRRGRDVTQTTISTTEIADVPVPHITAPPRSNVPIWRRDEALPRAEEPTPAPVLTGRAESLDIAAIPVIHDAEPVGGDAAINPRPLPIAYAEDAYGTTAFEVVVDERGTPTRCSITKSSGFPALDVSVCRAAMTAHYTPRTVNGKPTIGVYRDAFTFRELNADGSEDDQQPF